jgi:hypothetical protein
MGKRKQGKGDYSVTLPGDTVIQREAHILLPKSRGWVEVAREAFAAHFPEEKFPIQCEEDYKNGNILKLLDPETWKVTNSETEQMFLFDDEDLGIKGIAIEIESNYLEYNNLYWVSVLKAIRRIKNDEHKAILMKILCIVASFCSDKSVIQNICSMEGTGLHRELAEDDIDDDRKAEIYDEMKILNRGDKAEEEMKKQIRGLFIKFQKTEIPKEISDKKLQSVIEYYHRWMSVTYHMGTSFVHLSNANHDSYFTYPGVLFTEKDYFSRAHRRMLEEDWESGLVGNDMAYQLFTTTGDIHYMSRMEPIIALEELVSKLNNLSNDKKRNNDISGIERFFRTFRSKGKAKLIDLLVHGNQYGSPGSEQLLGDSVLQ